MTFHALEESVRTLLLKRIRHGNLTALTLAGDTGFRQPHISNFLNRKRGLSLSGLDRVLSAQHLSVADLVGSHRARVRSVSQKPGLVDVPVVSAMAAASIPLFSSEDMAHAFIFRKSFLDHFRSSSSHGRSQWERFVLVRVDAGDGLAMSPRLVPGATVLIDRHCASLAPYRGKAANMYLVLCDGICSIRYLELRGRQIALRPENPAYPVQLKTMNSKKSIADYIVGRICYVSFET
jgi:SOS-response transcriptional repressor LexA